MLERLFSYQSRRRRLHVGLEGNSSMKRLVLAVGLLLYWISPAQAQVCGGGASFKSGPYQAGASLSTASDFTIFDVGVGIGSDPWWGQGGLQVSSTTGVDGHAK